MSKKGKGRKRSPIKAKDLPRGMLPRKWQNRSKY
jgi:hypothetical protein